MVGTVEKLLHVSFCITIKYSNNVSIVNTTLPFNISSSLQVFTFCVADNSELQNESVLLNEVQYSLNTLSVRELP